MTKLKKVVQVTAAIAALQLSCLAKTPVLTGKMVAYDPLLHASKPSTTQSNKEVVILETSRHKKKYVKLVVISFGTKQIDEKFFDGVTPLSMQALRDHECDEESPRLATEISLNQKSGTYLLTEPFKAAPPRIKNLECYDATGKK